MNDVLLEIKGLSKDYLTLRPLRIKDLTVRRGDVLSISGVDVLGAETVGQAVDAFGSGDDRQALRLWDLVVLDGWCRQWMPEAAS